MRAVGKKFRVSPMLAVGGFMNQLVLHKIRVYGQPIVDLCKFPLLCVEEEEFCTFIWRISFSGYSLASLRESPLWVTGGLQCFFVSGSEGVVSTMSNLLSWVRSYWLIKSATNGLLGFRRKNQDEVSLRGQGSLTQQYLALESSNATSLL